MKVQTWSPICNLHLCMHIWIKDVHPLCSAFGVDVLVNRKVFQLHNAVVSRVDHHQHLHSMTKTSVAKHSRVGVKPTFGVVWCILGGMPDHLSPDKCRARASEVDHSPRSQVNDLLSVKVWVLLPRWTWLWPKGAYIRQVVHCLYGTAQPPRTTNEVVLTLGSIIDEIRVLTSSLDDYLRIGTCCREVSRAPSIEALLQASIYHWCARTTHEPYKTDHRRAFRPRFHEQVACPIMQF
mmetsp:Transcript_8340/g.14950  ORF Transcript_8340/g.14950 Transcript_8340/m.14950 type:complete len:237 (+) Transcript_8340:315-1025(+)